MLEQLDKRIRPFVEPLAKSTESLLPGLGTIRKSVEIGSTRPYTEFLRQSNERLSTIEGLSESALNFTPMGMVSKAKLPVEAFGFGPLILPFLEPLNKNEQ